MSSSGGQVAAVAITVGTCDVFVGIVGLSTGSTNISLFFYVIVRDRNMCHRESRIMFWVYLERAICILVNYF